jgi:hypothetical protein
MSCMLVPCSQCRRHVRDDGACPFCGGAPVAERPVVVEGHYSRRYAATLAAFGIAVAIDASACGAYGGPPPRASGEARVPRQGSPTETPDGFAARAKAKGCQVDRYAKHAYAHCEQGSLRVDFDDADGLVVRCPDLNDAECRALYDRLIAP